jgi:hypothetical protein
MAQVALLLALLVAVATAAGYDSAHTPLYADPVFDAAHDPEFVWHEGERCWWLAYLQNRYASPSTDPAGGCRYCSLTDIGLASTPDNGSTWVYRGVARGLDIPPALRHDHRNPTQQFGGATWYRPAVLRLGEVYHGFWVYSEVVRVGGYKIVHYTSTNLTDWAFVGVVAGDHGYDSVVFRVAATQHHRVLQNRSRWVIMSTNSPGNQAFESHDLVSWTPVNTSDTQLNRQIGEGPHVVEWRGAQWLNWEGCNEPMRAAGCIEGPGLLRSTDGGSHWLQLSPDIPNVGDSWIKSDSNASTGVYAHNGSRRFDIGNVHQGPISLLAGPADRAFKLWMAEFRLAEAYCNDNPAAFRCYRSVLQLAEVHHLPTGGVDGHGSLSVDRNAPFTVEFAPPLDALVDGKPGRLPPPPPVWHISPGDACVIALAELNRHVPTALYDQRQCAGCVGGCQNLTCANPQRLWRDADRACATYFSSMSSSGSGAGLVWTLQLARKDETTDVPLVYSFEVHGNGTILSLKNATSSLRVLQFYRPLLGGPEKNTQMKHDDDLTDVAVKPEADFFLSAWSYSPEPGWGAEGIGTQPMWSVDDWLRLDERTGTMRPYMNFIFASPAPGATQLVWAELSKQILARTGVNLPIMWMWDAWSSPLVNTTGTAASWAQFQLDYAAMRDRYPHLPAMPWGVTLGDEPPPSMAKRLPAATTMIRKTYRASILHLNWKWGDLTAQKNYPGAVNASVAKWCGLSELDWISSGEYYDVSIGAFQRSYQELVYPHLKATQRIVLLPFAAFCEIMAPVRLCPPNPAVSGACCPNMPINLTTADTHCLAKGENHLKWAQSDKKVVGMLVYRLKNIWQRGGWHGADPCTNPGPPMVPGGHSNGLGLVDRCGVNGSGSYATPKTVDFYHTVLSKIHMSDASSML